MKKKFVTLKKALPGFVAECTKVVNRENPLQGDIHVDDYRSLNYHLKRFLVGKEIWEDKDIFLLNLVYIKINMIWSGEYEIGNCVRVNYRKKVQNPEGDRRICADEVCHGIILYIYEMLDEDNFNLFRLTSEAWNEEYQSNYIYRWLKNDEELADVANRKVWRLWTEEDDDKEVEDVKKENDDKNNDGKEEAGKEEAGKEEAGKEITIDESSPINTYFKILYSTLLREKMEKAVELCGDTKSHLAFLELVIEAKEYTLCISCHKLFLEVLDAMEIKKYDVKTHNCVKGKYENLINDKNWKRKDKIKYDAIKKIFDEKVLV